MAKSAIKGVELEAGRLQAGQGHVGYSPLFASPSGFEWYFCVRTWFLVVVVSSYNIWYVVLNRGAYKKKNLFMRYNSVRSKRIKNQCLPLIDVCMQRDVSNTHKSLHICILFVKYFYLYPQHFL